MNTKDYIQHLLRNYKEIVAALNMLKLELQNFKGITPSEAIETLAFMRETGERIQTSGLSDKTAHMALVYQEYAKRLNSESKAEIFNSLLPLEYEIKLLETAVEGLSSQECDVIKALYFQQKSRRQVAYDQYTSERNIGRIRDQAIEKLVSIYAQYKRYSTGGVK